MSLDGFAPVVKEAAQPLLHTPAPSSVVLLSDLHLDFHSPAKTARLASLLDKDFAQAAAVLLVGDLADNLHQPETRAALQKTAKPFFAALSRLQQKGVPIHYIPGNHDGHFRENPLDWPALCAHSHGGETPVHLSFLGRSLRLSHGDEYDPIMQSGAGEEIAQAAFSDNLKPLLEGFYAFERRLFRFLGGAPARVIFPVAQRTSEHFEWLGRLTETPLPNPMFFMWRWELAARQHIHRENVDAVVMGHNHAPTVVDCGEGLYINTGDWLQHAVITWLDDRGAFQQDLSRPACFKSMPWPGPKAT